MNTDPTTIALVHTSIPSLISGILLIRTLTLYLYWLQAIIDAFNQLDLLQYLVDDD